MMEQKNRDTGSLRSIPVAIVSGFIPLIVRLHVYDSGFEDFDWFPASEDGILLDFFLYFKSVLIMAAAAVMVIICVSHFLKRRTDFKMLSGSKEMIPLYAYLFFVLVSGILSAHPKEAFLGAPEVFEGVAVIAGYTVICLYSFLFVRDENSIRTVLRWALPGLLIMLVIAFSQIISRDMMAAKFMASLMIPDAHAELRESLVFRFPPGVSYGTLYNSNYVVQYAGFAFFISLSLALCSSLDKKNRILAAVTAFFSGLFIIGSRSVSGFAAFMTGIVVYLIPAAITFFRTCTDNKKRTVFIILIVITCFIAIRTSGIGERMIGKAKMSFASGETKRLIEDVRTGEDCVTVTVNGKALDISYKRDGDDFQLYLKDENGSEPEYVLSEDGAAFRVEDAAYAGMEIYPVSIEDRLCMTVVVDGRKMAFSDFGKDGGYLYYNNAGKFSKFHRYEKSDLFPDAFFTDRGLIWNYCLKMLPHTLVRGYGANTFVYAYPNDDDYYRLYDENDVSYYDVKAHSLYFQQAVENGLPACLCFVLFYCVYFFGSLKYYAFSGIKRNDLLSCTGAGILAGSICYMISGIANDSNVNTATVFWAFLGIGYALLQQLKTNDNG